MWEGKSTICNLFSTCSATAFGTPLPETATHHPSLRQFLTLAEASQRFYLIPLTWFGDKASGTCRFAILIDRHEPLLRSRQVCLLLQMFFLLSTPNIHWSFILWKLCIPLLRLTPLLCTLPLQFSLVVPLTMTRLRVSPATDLLDHRLKAARSTAHKGCSAKSGKTKTGKCSLYFNTDSTSSLHFKFQIIWCCF